MLQASEYHVGEYLDWYQRTNDFWRVEKRKTIQWTPKARLIYAGAWFMLGVWLVVTLSVALATSGVAGFVTLLISLAAAPYLLAYGIIIPLKLVEMIVQRPLEQRALATARQKLASHRGIKIAIAGSYGKTSMREILRAVLAEGKRVAAPPASHNTPLAVAQFIGALTGDEEVIIFELGEYYPGDVRKLAELINPDVGVITGVNEAHLEKFKTLDQTTATIFELADYLRDKPVYINGENQIANAAARDGHIVYTRQGVGDWRIENAQTSLDGTTFTLVKNGVRHDAHSQLLGLHNVGPLVAAAAIADRLGLTPEQIVAGIAKTAPFEHRLQPRVDTEGVVTLDDSYNGNPDGVMAVLEFMKGLTGHRRWYVTPGLVEMGARTAEVHREIGRHIARNGIERVVLIRNSVTPYIAEGLTAGQYTGEVVWYDDAIVAYTALPQLTIAGDVVLLQNDWPDQYA